MTYLQLPFRPGGPLAHFEFRPANEGLAGSPWSWFDRRTGRWTTPTAMARETGDWDAALTAHAAVLDSLRRSADQLLDDREASQPGLATVTAGSPLESSCEQTAARLAMARAFMADFVVEARHAGAAVVDVRRCPGVVEDLLHMLADATNAVDTLASALTRGG